MKRIERQTEGGAGGETAATTRAMTEGVCLRIQRTKRERQIEREREGQAFASAYHQ